MNPAGPIHCFEHEAMHTTFSARLGGCTSQVARDAARAFFEELDRLEDCLSRFREASDVSRINALATGETLWISEACHACLLQASEAYAITGGLFDASLGASIRRFKEAGDGGTEAKRGGETGRLLIDPGRCAVTCVEAGREIDLGGIGKGFALDWLAPILDEWAIPAALLAAGRSTFLARGEKSWPLRAASPEPLPLCNRALSVSGDAVQGVHVLHPESGTPSMDPITAHRVWLAHESATLADALSTAALLVPLAELSGRVTAWGATLMAHNSNTDF